MVHPKAMGIGAMLVLLVAAVVLLPMLVRYIDKMEPHYVISGFQDMQIQNVPAVAAQSDYAPDKNTSYLCNVDASGKSCPEGTFCDGLTKSCISNYVGGPVPNTGYYS